MSDATMWEIFVLPGGIKVAIAYWEDWRDKGTYRATAYLPAEVTVRTTQKHAPNAITQAAVRLFLVAKLHTRSTTFFGQIFWSDWGAPKDHPTPKEVCFDPWRYATAPCRGSLEKMATYAASEIAKLQSLMAERREVSGE